MLFEASNLIKMIMPTYSGTTDLHILQPKILLIIIPTLFSRKFDVWHQQCIFSNPCCTLLLPQTLRVFLTSLLMAKKVPYHTKLRDIYFLFCNANSYHAWSHWNAHLAWDQGVKWFEFCQAQLPLKSFWLCNFEARNQKSFRFIKCFHWPLINGLK